MTAVPWDEPEHSAALGRIGYEAYAAATGGKTYDGRDMPAWSELPERIRAAWAAAARAIDDECHEGCA